jgi:6,7-dimethyl-8-ribityllumazine synthase
LSAWKLHGGEPASLRLERVPGAYELPLAARAFALSGSVDAVIALGCVIRGDTAHFDFVAGECAHGLQRVMLDTGVPVSFGVLTVENHQQALDRASADSLNKGGEAMTTALTMVDLLRRVK